MILWFGWYGFNPGSQLAIVTPTGSTYSIASAVSNAAVTTSLAPAAAGLTGLFVTAILLKLKTGKHHWDIMAMGNSTLAGLVAITAGCSTVYPWAAITIGIVAGFIYPLASRLMVLIRVCSRTLLETPFSLTCSVTNNFMWLLGGHWSVDAIFWMCWLKKLEVHYAEPLNVYYKKHLHVHVTFVYCACDCDKPDSSETAASQVCCADCVVPHCRLTTPWTPLRCTPSMEHGVCGLLDCLEPRT